MRNQKQRNRTPRPFKSKGAGRAWDGGSFIPASHKPAQRKLKPADAAPALPAAGAGPTETPAAENPPRQA